MVDTRRPRSPRPPVRLRPAPPLDPPCTDDDPIWSHGQLALDLIEPRHRDPNRPPGRAADHPLGRPRPPASGPSADRIAGFGPAGGGTAIRGTTVDGTTGLSTTGGGGGVGGVPTGGGGLASGSTRGGDLGSGAAGGGGAIGGGGFGSGASGGQAPDGPPTLVLATASPEAARAAHRFVRTFLEIVNGFRPPGQLRPLCVPETAAQVSAEFTRAARRVTPVRRRAARPALHLRRLRVCEPRAGAVEATAVFTGAGGTSWAIAVRLEHRRGTWLCLVLTVL
ncbi:Rv3235 family protein [Micromonospora sp. NPDC051300]|uniref:Rv3235 family protein n=1 Tax=Micromonospora sp. NPDC051300 TaxID=3364286 RepID=UPI00378D23FE